MWMYTKAVLSNGRRCEPPLDWDFIQGVIVESYNLDEWITDTSVALKENEILEALNYEIDVPCPLQWGL